MVMLNVTACILSLLHVIIIAYVVIVPLLPKQSLDMLCLLIVHVGITASMIIHWIFNDDSCFLTLLESQVRGISHDRSFMHRLISPFYNIDDTTLGVLIKVVTYLLLFVSLSRVQSFLQSRSSKGNSSSPWTNPLLPSNDESNHNNVEQRQDLLETSC